MTTLKFCDRPDAVYVGENTTVRDVMNELAALRADAERLRGIEREAIRVLAAVVASAGGTVAVPSYALVRDLVLERWHDYRTDRVVFTARAALGEKHS